MMKVMVVVGSGSGNNDMGLMGGGNGGVRVMIMLGGEAHRPVKVIYIPYLTTKVDQTYTYIPLLSLPSKPRK